MSDINNLNNNGDIYWGEFYGKTSKKLYRIVSAKSEQFEKIIYFMSEYFIKEEPTCKYLKCYEDTECVNEMQQEWKECLKDNLTLVCIDSSGNEEKIAGFILLMLVKKNDENPKPTNEKWIKINNILSYVSNKNDPLQFFAVNEYLSDFGMLVLPNFRKDGVAENLLIACEKMCQENKFVAFVITCSSIASQNLTRKLNYIQLSADTYKNLRKINPEKYGIEGIEEHTEEIKCMYKLFS